MTNIRYIARVSEADHDALGIILPGYPDYSYDKWRQRQAQEIASWEADGAEVRPIDVTKDQVIRYCGPGPRREGNVLSAVAAAIGTGKFK